MLKKLIRAIRDPRLFILKANSLGWFNWMDDATNLELLYRLHMGKELDLDNPKTFNEKLQWLKIHDRKDIYTTMVDKIAAKKYVADIIGEEYIIPTLGVWNHFDEIDFDKLPNQFVLKCNHDSGSIVIVKDKSKFDKVDAKKKLERGLKRNLFWYAREWPYKNVKPKILAEEYMGNLEIPTEYKIFCLNEKAKILLYCEGEGHTNNRTNDFYYIDDFVHIDLRGTYSNASKQIESNEIFRQIVSLSEKLAHGTYQLRVDWYLANNKIYFGECTFYNDAGYTQYNPAKYDLEFGQMLKLD